LKTKSTKTDKVNVITLGCSKNLVDSENLIGQLKGNDIEVAHESNEDSNIVVVNTCGFIDMAKQESIDTILNYADAKTNGDIEKLLNAWFGTMDLPFLLKELGADYKHELIGERQGLTTPKHYAYLKISEGCNRTCAFCAIPLMRGKHISRPIEDLVFEAKNLVKKGVKEIMLIAQELTYYGLDIYKKRSLPELLNQLAEVEGLEWIRLHYAYPSKFPIDIIKAIKKHPNICNYLDMPLQHASNAVLQNMKRQITREDTVELISNIRNILPEIAIRTTMLVGFPGETEKDIDELKKFIEQQRFERLGVFTYSHEEGTSGYDLQDDILEEVKQQRAAEVMEVQQEISDELNQAKIGQTFKVLFDRKEGDQFIGRTEYDSPEVDNEVIVDAKENYVRIGDFANATITNASDFDLYGKL